MKANIWIIILLGVLTLTNIVQNNRINKLSEEVNSLRNQEINLGYDALDRELDLLYNNNCKLDSLLKLMEKPKPIVVKRQKKKKGLDSAEVAHIEYIIFHELLKEQVDSSMARIIVAIAKHESRSFDSGLFRGTNNLFGMTYPPRRPTLAIGHKVYLDNGNVRKFCKFESVSQATRDMVLYLKHWKYDLDIGTPEEMVRTMKSKRYFEANESVYLRAVKRHLSQLSV